MTVGGAESVSQAIWAEIRKPPQASSLRDLRESVCWRGLKWQSNEKVINMALSKLDDAGATSVKNVYTRPPGAQINKACNQLALLFGTYRFGFI